MADAAHNRSALAVSIAANYPDLAATLAETAEGPPPDDFSASQQLARAQRHFGDIFLGLHLAAHPGFIGEILAAISADKAHTLAMIQLGLRRAAEAKASPAKAAKIGKKAATAAILADLGLG